MSMNEKLPAIKGGKVVRKKFLIFGQPRFFKEELVELLDTLRSGWWGTGPKTIKFQEEFAKYIGCHYALGLNSCTSALELALDVLKINDGDEVITTPLTFAATANVIVHRRATPVFADINPADWNINPEEIEKKITKKTKAIIVVHLHGRPCQMDKILTLAKKHKLFVIEDAAHALEAWYKGKKIGTFGEFGAFSFYVTKNVATAEGGMLVTNNKKWFEEARIKSLHGISADAWKRYSASGFKPYETIYAGYKFNMTDIQASLGIHQLRRINKNLKIRKKYWQIYMKAFKDLKEINLPTPIDKNIIHGMHIFAIVLDTSKLKINRDQFIQALQAENIGSGIHFTPLHLHKFYRQTYGFKKGMFPRAEYIGQRFVSLPFYPHMSKQDIDDVIKAVKKIIFYYKK
jgi:dTDP-4-amino-4,6-dideoxygalactose transaminase